MPRVQLVMLKLLRLSGWVLLVLLAVQFSTVAVFQGFGPVDWGHSALVLHKNNGVPIGVFVVLHAAAAVYLAVRRWTWKARHPQT